MPRLVITGMGAVTPIGIGVNVYWQNLIAGHCGIGPITHFDASRLPVRIAAEVRDFESHMPRQVLRSASPFMQYAFAAGEEALAMSGINPAGMGGRMGICMGTAMAGVTEICARADDYAQSATGKISPHFVPRAIGNMAAAHLAICHNITGPGFTLATACSAGGDAIMLAAQLISGGEADAVLALGAESILCAPVVSSLAQAKALSRLNGCPQKASRPFDLHRDGFVIGEGAGALIIEKPESAQARGAEILAVLAGWGNTMDAFHVTAPDPEGHGAARCMRRALARAGLQPADIDYVNAHGTATPLGDYVETLALKEVFGDLRPAISSTKGATGHLMGAGGLTEAIACIQAIRYGIAPPTINLENPDPQCDLDYVPLAARKCAINAAMSNSMGFGGQNSSIILTRPHLWE